MPADFARVSLRAAAPRSAAQQAMPTRQPRARRGGVPSRAETLARVGNADGIAQPEPQCAHGARHLCANGRVVCTRSSCARAVMRVRGRWDRSGGTMPEHAASDSSPLRTHRPAVCAAQWLHSASRCALRCAQRHTRPSFRTGVRPHACGCAHSLTLHLLARTLAVAAVHSTPCPEHLRRMQPASALWFERYITDSTRFGLQ